MGTRKQLPTSRLFRQDAFSSSVEHERGILGNLVATRCHQVSTPDEVAMLWWLQQISWRNGGLSKFAESLLTRHSDRIGTPTMIKIGMEPDRVFNANQVRQIRQEIKGPQMWHSFRLKGEPDPLAMERDGVEFDESSALQEADQQPDSYPINAFRRVTGLTPEALAATLAKSLVDPASPSLRHGLWNFPKLWATLEGIRDAEIRQVDGRLVETSVTRGIAEELDYAHEAREFVLIEGREGIGKSEGARAWCDRHPGQAIYVRLESGSDETTLYRSIARRIGTACSYQRKAIEMRARIQDALQGGHVMLVLDEAHFLWPQSERSVRSAPKRLDWLRTALIDFGVPVALISTPQHFATQCNRFRKSGWNANQIQRRLARVAVLPETLSAEEVIACAGAYFPSAPQQTLKRVAAAALLSVGRLTTLSHLRKRVDFLASRQPDRDESELLQVAFEEIAAGLVPANTKRTGASPTAQPSQAGHGEVGAPDRSARTQPRLKELLTSAALE